MAMPGKALLVVASSLAISCAFLLFLSWPADSTPNTEPPPSLKASLETALGVSRSATPVELAQIERFMQSTFDALPKEREGRVGTKSAHFMIYRYFTERYAWRINGLESLGSKMVTKTLTKKGFLGFTPVPSYEKLADVELLQDTAPSFAKALGRHEESVGGFVLPEVAVIVAAMHQVILDEARWILEECYKLNGHRTGEHLAEDEAWSILRSFVLVLDFGLETDVLEPEAHDIIKQAGPEMWNIHELFGFTDDMFMNSKYKMKSSLNPFVAPRFSFLAVEEISHWLLESFGRWQTDRCRAMKTDLVTMSSPQGSGRVPYDTFHANPRNSDPLAPFAFTESVQKLRNAQALDETTPGTINVLVANFIQLPSNCVDTSKYYSICCVDECEGLMQDLEAQVNAPAATAEVLLALVSNLSSSTVDAPRDLDPALVDKLYGIANQHDGLVPLHSRLFWQWVHFAYPNECPFPQAGATSGPARGPQDLGAAGSLALWSDYEVLPLEEQSKDPLLRRGLLICSSLQIFGMIALLSMMFSLWGTARRIHSAGKVPKKIVIT